MSKKGKFRLRFLITDDWLLNLGVYTCFWNCALPYSSTINLVYSSILALFALILVIKLIFSFYSGNFYFVHKMQKSLFNVDSID